MSMAGIWDTWRGGSPDARQSFTIMTAAANDVMKGIHDRMPVILDDKKLDEWLDPEVQERDAIEKLLQPCPPAWLGTSEISTLVNSPKNNSSAVLDGLGKE